MLDTYGRKFVDPAIRVAATQLVHRGFNANQVTICALVLGCCSGLLVYLGQSGWALVTLWLSGYLDAVDGAMARLTKPSTWGTVLDVTFDRLVEISIIWGLAWRYPEATWALLLLSTAIIVSMTVFLTVGAVSEHKGMKTFYYQPGLAERTEGFICFSLMIFFHQYLTVLTLIFFAMIVFTVGQRLREAQQILN